MRKNLFSKSFVFGIVVLFVGITISSGINADVKKELSKNFTHPIATIREEARFVSRLSLEEQIDILQPRIYNFHRSNMFNGFVFSPEDIELKDDAFHGSNTFHFVEWWYFDAILNNGYSIHINIYVFGFMEQRFVVAGLNIYKNGMLEANEQKIYLNNFHISTDIPLVILDGKQVMKGYIDQTTGEWIYNVSLEIGDSLVDLQFIGGAKGWKGRIPIDGWWAVILPKAEVSGIIRVNGIEADVVGSGYHDHNWDMTLRMCLNFGWYWGRIISTNLTMVWFVIMNTRISGQLLLVINKGKEDYINIEPDNIHFIAGDFSIENMRLIPHSFVLKADTQNVSLHVVLTAFGLHHGKTGGVRQYWRYHVKSQGSITVDSEMETISGIQIAEFMRFR